MLPEFFNLSAIDEKILCSDKQQNDPLILLLSQNPDRYYTGFCVTKSNLLLYMFGVS